MKKIFLTFILITTSVFSYAKIETLEANPKQNLLVVCISGYVFVIDSINGGVTQFYIEVKEWGGEQRYQIPMRCEQYVK